MTETIKVNKNGDNIQLSNCLIKEVINIDVKAHKANNIEIFFKKLYVEKVIRDDKISFSFSEELTKYLPNDDKDRFMIYLLECSLSILNE